MYYSNAFAQYFSRRELYKDHLVALKQSSIALALLLTDIMGAHSNATIWQSIQGNPKVLFIALFAS